MLRRNPGRLDRFLKELVVLSAQGLASWPEADQSAIRRFIARYRLAEEQTLWGTTRRNQRSFSIRASTLPAPTAALRLAWSRSIWSA